MIGIEYFALFAAGYAACWFSKDLFSKWIMGAEGFAKALEAKLSAVKIAIQ